MLEARGRTVEPDPANRTEVAVREPGLAGGRSATEQQHHPVEPERLYNPADQPLAQPLEVQIRVQIAREPGQGATIVEPLAIVGAVEHRLNGSLDRPRQQHHDRRRQQGDDRAVLIGLVEENFGGQSFQPEIDDDHRRHDRRPAHAPLDDDFDVAEAIADDCRRERQWNQAERDGGQLDCAGWIETERVGQRVRHRERQAAEHRARHDPAKLAPRRAGARAAETGDHRRQPPQRARRQIEVLQAPDPLDDLQEAGSVLRTEHGPRLHETEHHRRCVHEGQDGMPEPPAKPARGALRKHQGEVHEERGQQQDGHFVRPEEDPVETVVATGVRECEHAEERNGQPEEMERCPMPRTLDPDRRADEQTEQSNRCKHEVGGQRDSGGLLERDGVQPLLAETQQGVVEPLPVGDGAQQTPQVCAVLNRLAPDGEKHVARFDPRPRRRRVRIYRRGDQAVRAVRPEDAVVHVPAAGAYDRVGHGQAHQRGNDAHGQQSAAPLPPITARARLAINQCHDSREPSHANRAPCLFSQDRSKLHVSSGCWGIATDAGKWTPRSNVMDHAARCLRDKPQPARRRRTHVVAFYDAGS